MPKYVKDKIGNLLKKYEHSFSYTLMPEMPVIARIDGRAFHTFTRGLRRPYDERLSKCMIETTRFLIENSHAILGYTQSDEISLIYNPQSIFFDGKIQKITSVLSSLATVEFYKQILEKIPEKASDHPAFDCRIFQVSNKELVVKYLEWRERDANKNAISMAAFSQFSHTRLHGMKSAQKIELLKTVANIEFSEYPRFFRQGTFLKKIVRNVPIEESIRLNIKEKYRPEYGTLVTRSFVEEQDWLRCNQMTNFVNVIFESQNPEYM